MVRVLVACEESQAVTIEFRKLGFETYSCDIQPCSGGHPEWHLQQDVTPLLKEKWDLIVAHPPCTYLANSGVQHLKKGENLERMYKMNSARSLFLACLSANSGYIAVENPVPHSYAHLPKYSQIIQPWMFGHPVTKRTCLWLKGLPLLSPTNIVDKGERYIGKNGKSNGSKWYHLMSTKGRSKMRSKTFSGIARAMAEQWSNLIK